MAVVWGPEALRGSAPPVLAAVAGLLGCMARLWTVRRDGVLIAPDWTFDADPLARGLLEVSEVPTPSQVEAADPGSEPEIRRHFIRFWI